MKKGLFNGKIIKRYLSIYIILAEKSEINKNGIVQHRVENIYFLKSISRQKMF